jgi:hypothetical protein
MDALSCTTLGLAGPPVYLDAHQLLYASGNGLIAQDVETGLQVRPGLTTWVQPYIWTT